MIECPPALDGSVDDAGGAGDSGDATAFVGVALAFRLGICNTVLNGMELRRRCVRLEKIKKIK